jgi:hypothetical protein
LGELNEINQNNIILKKRLKKSNKILIKLTSRVNQAKQYHLKVNFILKSNLNYRSNQLGSRLITDSGRV